MLLHLLVRDAAEPPDLREVARCVLLHVSHRCPSVVGPLAAHGSVVGLGVRAAPRTCQGAHGGPGSVRPWFTIREPAAWCHVRGSGVASDGKVARDAEVSRPLPAHPAARPGRAGPGPGRSARGRPATSGSPSPIPPRWPGAAPPPPPSSSSAGPRPGPGSAPSGRPAPGCSLDRLPRHVVTAVLASEDARFFGHEGIDWAATRDAAEHDLSRGRFARGASTITQQLAKNLWLGTEKSLWRKAKEAVLAWKLERALPKRRILALYLNVVELGNGVFGIEAGARARFGVPAVGALGGPGGGAGLAAPGPPQGEPRPALDLDQAPIAEPARPAAAGGPALGLRARPGQRRAGTDPGRAHGRPRTTRTSPPTTTRPTPPAPGPPPTAASRGGRTARRRSGAREGLSPAAS